jgi:hypothetical protein
MKVELGVERPRRVTLFSLLVLLFGSGLNLARAIWAWGAAAAFADMSVSTALPMEWLAALSLIWSVVFALCAIGLWRLQTWGWFLTLAAVSLFHGHIWLNHFLFDRSFYAKQLWPFALVHTAVVLLGAWGFLIWPSVRRLYLGHLQTMFRGDDR